MLEGGGGIPFIVAVWRGDPNLPGMVGSAPRSRRYLAAATAPKVAEMNSAVSPAKEETKLVCRV